MIIFLRSIPAKAKRRDIIAFIEPTLKRGWFARNGAIESIKILQLKDTRTKISEYHGLVTVNPDVIAVKVIKRLNRKVFLGKHIAVRRFERRDWHNDPREDYKGIYSDSEKRASDRRRMQMEEVADLSRNFSSNRNFHREHY